MKQTPKRLLCTVLAGAAALLAVPLTPFTQVPVNALTAYADTVITEVGVNNVIAPINGAHPVFGGISTAHSTYFIADDGFGISGVYWEDSTTKTALKQSDTFTEGHSYVCSVKLLPEDGYAFPANHSSVKGTVNGKTGVISDAAADTVPVFVSYTFTALPTQTVSTASVSGLRMPAAGETPGGADDVWFMSPAHYHLYQNTPEPVEWYNVTDGAYLKAGETFEAGKKYRVYVYAETDEGYVFADADSFQCSFDGNTGEIRESSDTVRALVCNYDAAAISVSYLTPKDILRPVAGENPGFDITSGAPEKYTAKLTEWRDSTNGKALDPTAPFEAGHQYQARVFYEAKDGYLFAPKDEINSVLYGRAGSIGQYSQKAIGVIYLFDTLSGTPITEVSAAGIAAPAAGEKPQYDGIAVGRPDKYYIDTERPAQVEWYDVTNGRYLGSDETFQSGVEYRVSVHLTAGDGCVFPSAAAITARVNFEAAGLIESSETHLILTYTFPKTEGTPTVARVTVMDVEEPAAGGHPTINGIRVLPEEQVELMQVDWWDTDTGDYLTEDSVFAIGKEYCFRVWIRAKDGYTLPSTPAGMDAYINGVGSDYVADEVNSSTKDGQYTIRKYYRLEPETVDKVTVKNLKLPVIGMHPDLECTVEPADKATVTAVQWINRTTKDIMTEDDVFEADTEYLLDVYMLPAEGYAFPATANDLKVYINEDGSDMFLSDKVYSVGGDGNENKRCASTVYTAMTPTEVNKVIVKNLTLPVIGMHPDLECTVEPADKATVTAVQWINRTTKDIMTEDDVFEADTEYLLDVYMLPAEGYAFPATANDLKVYINEDGSDMFLSDKVYSVGGDGNENKRCASTVYTAMAPTEVDKVIIKGVEPAEAGQHPSLTGLYLSNDGAQITGWDWTVKGTSELLTKEAVFEPSTTYMLRVYVKPKPGYTFPETYSGLKAFYNSDDTDEHLASLVNGVASDDALRAVIFYFTTGDISYVKSVTVKGIVPPVAGQEPIFDGYAIDDNSQIELYMVDWSEYGTDHYLHEGDCFEEGKEYLARFWVKAADGYELPGTPEELTAYYNAKDDNHRAEVNDTTVEGQYVVRVRMTAEPADHVIYFESGKPAVIELPPIGNDNAYYSWAGNRKYNGSWTQSAIYEEYEADKYTGSINYSGVYSLTTGLKSDYDGAFVECRIWTRADGLLETHRFILKEYQYTVDRNVTLTLPKPGDKCKDIVDQVKLAELVIDEAKEDYIHITERDADGKAVKVTMADDDEFRAGYKYEFCFKVSLPKHVAPIVINDFYGKGLIINGAEHGAADSLDEEDLVFWDYWTTPVLTADDFLLGDVNGNGEIAADDAQIALKAYVNMLAGKESGLTAAQEQAADIDGDGEVTATDAQIILKYYVNTLAGKEVTWESLLPKK